MKFINIAIFAALFSSSQAITLQNENLVQVKSYASTISDIQSKVNQLEQLVEKQENPDWQELALGLISQLNNPIHGMILSWKDWWMAQNGLGAPEKWSPETNPIHTIRSEVSDVYKAMTHIRMLENKLKNFDRNSGTTNYDWNLLNSLKREMGINVEFGNDKKAQAGQGNIASKVMAANM